MPIMSTAVQARARRGTKWNGMDDVLFFME